jgi:UDP-N-acetylmuramoylalanine--D-glutamate ligase
MGELDFAAPCLKGRILGVTGSNGKTTVTSLVRHILKSLGYRTAAVGNIGSPISDAAGVELDFVIAELSSFQLHWAASINLAGAIVTSIAPDHLDWHGSYENYVRAKAKIASFVEGDGFVIAKEQDAAELGLTGAEFHSLSWDAAPAEKGIVLDRASRTCSIGDVPLFGFDDIGLLGAHNLENAAMSMAGVFMMGGDAASALDALRSFEAPSHRCSLVMSRGGVRYIDDSKGTNIAATIAALSSIDGSKIVILGGRGKGEDYSRLAGPLKKFAKYALLIGEAAAEIAASLSSGGYEDYAVMSGMEEAVERAAAMASAGDAVLLSPACASWDMYRNYGERGNHFARLVMGLGWGEDEANDAR